MDKAPDAYRTISEVADDLDIAQHVLRFWETKFPQIKPLKRGGGRRYYRPDDVDLVTGIRHLLYKEGYTIKGVQRILKEHGPRAVMVQAEQPQTVAASAPPPPAIRQPVVRFQEPEPQPYIPTPDPVAQRIPEPVIPPVAVPARDMLFDLPEMRKGASLERGEAAPARDPIIAREPGQVSMVRGGLPPASYSAPNMLPPDSQSHLESIAPTEAAPVPPAFNAPPLAQPYAYQGPAFQDHATLADALNELEAIRAGLAALLERRPG